MTVKAPFAFARIPRAVWYPDWGDRVSHDVPFKDGWSGTLTLKLTAATELLIGGERRKATDQRAGEVWPVQLPDGTYAIPPSSLQGMIRSVLEIACFGKLGPWVEERRFGVRDLTGDSVTASALYKNRISSKFGNLITPRTKAAWIKRDQAGQVMINLCEVARIEHSEIARNKLPKSSADLLDVLQRNAPYHDRQREAQTKDAPSRYDAFLGSGHTNKDGLEIVVNLSPKPQEGGYLHSPGLIDYQKCEFGTQTTGTLILTGKPQGTSRRDGTPIHHTKHMEFVFHTPSRTDAQVSQGWRQLSDDVWRDFLLIHEPPKGSGQKVNPNWIYWKGEFAAGNPIPIFLIEDIDERGEPIGKSVAAIGTAFMFKLAQTNSTHDMLANSKSSEADDGEHVSKWSGSAEDTTGRLDLPSLIFGAVGGKQGDWFRCSLKHRAAFGWATAAVTQLAKAQNDDSDKAILLGPKPSYVPIYVRQPQQPDGQHRIADGQPYASYTPYTADNNLHRKEPELSGVKIWPAAQDKHRSPTFKVPENPPRTGNAVKNKLNAIPAGTTFDPVTLHIHNLRAVELGALIWALTLGRDEAIGGGESLLRHRIGMGKPFGLGSLKLSITGGNLVPNASPRLALEGEDALAQLRTMIIDFVSGMDKVCVSLGSWEKDAVAPTPAKPFEWANTVQVLALQKAAKPESGKPEPYMKLGESTSDSDGTYIGERKAGSFLPPYNNDKGWELVRAGDAIDRPAERNGRPQPQSKPDGNRSGHHQNAAGSGRRDSAGSGPSATQSNFRQEKGCPVLSLDGSRRGAIVELEHGVVTIQWDDTVEPERGAFNYIITGSPEL